MSDFKINQPDLSKIVSDISVPADINPDELAPNRTANSVEKTVELLQVMIDNMNREASAQHRRFVAEVWLSVGSIVVASIAAFASLYALYLTIANI